MAFVGAWWWTGRLRDGVGVGGAAVGGYARRGGVCWQGCDVLLALWMMAAGIEVGVCMRMGGDGVWRWGYLGGLSLLRGLSSMSNRPFLLAPSSVDTL